ncbi:MAG: hypothetical protein HY856_00470 [Burkholderiales bacterium]|nr:hypothetical protein [Burkholderiales bacterium]
MMRSMLTWPQRWLPPVLAAFMAVTPTTPQLCPQDKTPMTATGNTRQENGKMLAEYKCEQGHLYWVAVD